MQTCIVLTSRGELVSAVPPEKGGGGLSATFKIGCSSGFGHELLDGPIELVANNRSQLKICSCKAVLGCLKCSSRIVRLMTMKKKLYQRPPLPQAVLGCSSQWLDRTKALKDSWEYSTGIPGPVVGTCCTSPPLQMFLFFLCTGCFTEKLCTLTVF